ncbi:CLUMA_CG016041, isoform A [Clunio marinus]|uniref:CLUMA_CG016041, isoform A n=1 Tax=Clunio marinus TaxID=568069 RepID=A0A1J1ISW6_9DIPT|nr:CLUMA_CG016041, isoform A [Clunio marinus]
MSQLCGARCGEPFDKEDKSVVCSGPCRLRFHKKCSPLSSQQYELLMKTDAIVFRCKSCSDGDKFILSNYEKILNKFDTLEKKMDSSLKKVCQQIDEIKKKETNDVQCMNEISKVSKQIEELNKKETNDVQCMNEITKVYKQIEELRKKETNDVQLMNKITKVIDDRCQPAWNEVVKKKQAPVVVLVPKDKSKNRNDTKSSVKSLIKESDLSVNKMSRAANGGLIIECDDEDKCNKVLSAVNKTLGKDYTVQKPNARQPRLKILKIRNPIEDNDELINDLKQHNKCLKFDSCLMEVIKREQYSTSFVKNI